MKMLNLCLLEFHLETAEDLILNVFQYIVFYIFYSFKVEGDYSAQTLDTALLICYVVVSNSIQTLPSAQL